MKYSDFTLGSGKGGTGGRGGARGEQQCPGLSGWTKVTHTLLDGLFTASWFWALSAHYQVAFPPLSPPPLSPPPLVLLNAAEDKIAIF